MHAAEASSRITTFCEREETWWTIKFLKYYSRVPSNFVAYSTPQQQQNELLEYDNQRWQKKLKQRNSDEGKVSSLL
jgi:hypothetical protein